MLLVLSKCVQIRLLHYSRQPQLLLPSIALKKHSRSLSPTRTKVESSNFQRAGTCQDVPAALAELPGLFVTQKAKPTNYIRVDVLVVRFPRAVGSCCRLNSVASLTRITVRRAPLVDTSKLEKQQLDPGALFPLSISPSPQTRKFLHSPLPIVTLFQPSLQCSSSPSLFQSLLPVGFKYSLSPRLDSLVPALPLVSQAPRTRFVWACRLEEQDSEETTRATTPLPSEHSVSCHPRMSIPADGKEPRQYPASSIQFRAASTDDFDNTAATPSFRELSPRAILAHVLGPAALLPSPARVSQSLSLRSFFGFGRTAT